MTDAPLFTVTGLHLSVPDLSHKPLFGPAPMLEILKGLDLELPRGRVTGIVGESGSGKSSLGRCLVRLHRPEAGRILFDGTDIRAAGEAALRPLRKDLQMIFQDPLSALNPRRRVGAIIAAPMRAVGIAGDHRELALEALDKVGLPRDFAGRYPHQLSGGQRQRVGIARAIGLNPKFILADEIVSGLDVSTQAQIITLLERLVAEMDLTLAFISHDLSVIRRLCHRVVVMRAGEIVEQAETGRIFDDPQHPYTRRLLAAIPLPELDPDWLGAEDGD